MENNDKEDFFLSSDSFGGSSSSSWLQKRRQCCYYDLTEIDYLSYVRSVVDMGAASYTLSDADYRDTALRLRMPFRVYLAAAGGGAAAAAAPSAVYLLDILFDPASNTLDALGYCDNASICSKVRRGGEPRSLLPPSSLHLNGFTEIIDALLLLSSGDEMTPPTDDDDALDILYYEPDSSGEKQQQLLLLPLRTALDVTLPIKHYQQILPKTAQSLVDLAVHSFFDGIAQNVATKQLPCTHGGVQQQHSSSSGGGNKKVDEKILNGGLMCGYIRGFLERWIEPVCKPTLGRVFTSADKLEEFLDNGSEITFKPFWLCPQNGDGDECRIMNPSALENRWCSVLDLFHWRPPRITAAPEPAAAVSSSTAADCAIDDDDNHWAAVGFLAILKTTGGGGSSNSSGTDIYRVLPHQGAMRAIVSYIDRNIVVASSSSESPQKRGGKTRCGGGGDSQRRGDSQKNDDDSCFCCQTLIRPVYPEDIEYFDQLLLLLGGSSSSSDSRHCIKATVAAAASTSIIGEFLWYKIFLRYLRFRAASAAAKMQQQQKFSVRIAFDEAAIECDAMSYSLAACLVVMSAPAAATAAAAALEMLESLLINFLETRYAIARKRRCKIDLGGAIVVHSESRIETSIANDRKNSIACVIYGKKKSPKLCFIVHN